MTTGENRAYNEGLDAAGKEANPHLHGSSLYDSWESGWQQGADEDYEEEMNRE